MRTGLNLAQSSDVINWHYLITPKYSQLNLSAASKVQVLEDFMGTGTVLGPYLP